MKQSQQVQSSVAVVVLVAVVALLLSSITITFPKLHWWGSSEPHAAHSEAAAPPPPRTSSSSSSSMPTEVEEIHDVKIERNPPQSRLDELGVFTWPTWSSGPSKIPWTFKSKETMYFLEGKVKVKVKIEPGNNNEDGDDGDEEEDEGMGWFEIGKGDLAVFPKGMNIIWNMVEPVNKHFLLHRDDDNNHSHKDD